MKKFNFEIIKKIDYIMIFLAGLFVLGAIIVFCVQELVDSLSPRTIPTIPIIENNDKVEIKEKVEFYRKLDDIFVFRVRSNGIKSDEMEAEPVYSDRSSSISNLYQSKSYGKSGEVINLIFVKDGVERKLFESNNSFIYRNRLKTEDCSENRYYCNQNFNLYVVISADTNGDKFLNSKDNLSLYISNYDGSDLKMISSSIFSCELIEDNQLLYTENDGTKTSYYLYDGTKKSISFIKSVNEVVTEKSISL